MKRDSLSLWALDAAGGALTLLLLALGAWSAWPQRSPGDQHPQNLTAALASAKNDLATLRSSLEQQKALQARYQSDLNAAGAMPDQSPQETHLQLLSGLAAQNHLSVVRQLPLSPREYPGLLEQRFAYEVTGTMPDLARFFKAVESSTSWTDISYVKVDQGKGVDNTGQRNALLTFSAFSMARQQPPAAAQPAQGG